MTTVAMTTTLNEFESSAPGAFQRARGRSRPRRSPFRRFGHFVRHALGPVTPLSRVAWISLAIAGVGVSTLAFTYFALSRSEPFDITRTDLLVLIAVDLAIIFSIAPVIAWRLIRLFASRKESGPASTLHVRMVALLSVMTLAPAIVIASFSAVTLTTSLNSLLGGPVETAVQNSAAMTRLYVDDQTRVLGQDLVFMANDVNNNSLLFRESPLRFEQFLAFQIRARRLSSAHLISDDGTLLARAETEDVPDFTVPRPEVMDVAGDQPAVFSEAANNQLRGVVGLPDYDNGYLVVGRILDPSVYQHFGEMKDFLSGYEAMEDNRSLIELVFVLTFVMIALIILLGAIWLGLRVANNLVSPIGRLMTTAEKVSDGDLTARVPLNDSNDEINELSRTFNRMTGQLQSQRAELVETNERLDDRRRFTEAVLTGVSAGVLGIDANGKVSMANQSAATLLSVPRDSLIGKDIVELLPAAAELIGQDRQPKGNGFLQAHIDHRVNGQTRHFNVQMTETRGNGEDHGLVVTFDDISKLVSAQRTAAWADVARRIAHEIRNPLTPIQLSAERLRRKYGREIVSDPDVFEQCTGTIVRQVKDIGRMVDEFSSFARMPAPVMRDRELIDLVKRSVFSQRIANPEIDYEIALPDKPVVNRCDGRLIEQALTNLLKNAAEAITAKAETLEGEPERDAFVGRIKVTLGVEAERISIAVDDNGCGLPENDRHRLAEPYVTKRSKGTGLGLAIVKKIMEDHGGELSLNDSRETGGASVALILPRLESLDRPAPAEEETDDRSSRVQ